MSNYLQVAVGIADAISTAHAFQIPLDIEAQTRVLSEHIVAPKLTPEIIADVLRSEGRDAGVRIV